MQGHLGFEPVVEGGSKRRRWGWSRRLKMAARIGASLEVGKIGALGARVSERRRNVSLYSRSQQGVRPMDHFTKLVQTAKNWATAPTPTSATAPTPTAR